MYKFLQAFPDDTEAIKFYKSNEKYTDDIQELIDAYRGFAIKRKVVIKSLYGIDNIKRFISELNPKSQKKKAYLTLDSRYAKFSDDCKKLTWVVSESISEFDNSTNTTCKIRNITDLQLQSFTVRKFDSVAQRASICIEEFRAQSFSFPNGRKFHTIALLNDLINPVALGERNAKKGNMTIVPDVTFHDKYELLSGYKFNDGKYHFNQPITLLDTITVSVGDPFDLVTIPKYEFTNVLISFDPNNAAMLITFPEPHRHIGFNYNIYMPNSLVSLFIDDYKMANPSDIPGFEEQINGTEITSARILNDTQMLFSPYYSSLSIGERYVAFPYPGMGLAANPIQVGTARVRINSYRVIINLELDYID